MAQHPESELLSGDQRLFAAFVHVPDSNMQQNFLMPSTWLVTAGAPRLLLDVPQAMHKTLQGGRNLILFLLKIQDLIKRPQSYPG